MLLKNIRNAEMYYEMKSCNLRIKEGSCTNFALGNKLILGSSFFYFICMDCDYVNKNIMFLQSKILEHDLL